ncbi:hypothetical protein AM587_10009687 [Phytophthora nicotianae]|uniref:Uncharacterized protein n=1 Tax=Phytophthora nicotianae TaxID=4792 RepID=A0A0W8CYV4_PHYNI|nr:hypothetical protein AM587_10009687 [Phytophthora nicotianae]
MAKPIFSPGSAIQRAKPLFELSDAGGETHCGKRAKKSTKVALPARAEQVIPFNSETILEAINCSPGISLGSSGSQGDLAHLDLELADAKDLFAESITRTIDGELPEQGTERLSRRDGDDTTNAGTDPMLSAMPSRSLVSLAPLKAPLQKFKGPNRSSMAHSAPRVAQRYQYVLISILQFPRSLRLCLTRLRHPDDLIAEASERRRIVDEVPFIRQVFG